MNKDKDRHFLELVLDEAEKALSEDTYPVGAVIVDDNQNIISTGRNRVHSGQDATAHAEMDAIRNAGTSIFKAKIEGETFTIYTTLEPCPMCAWWNPSDYLGVDGEMILTDELSQSEVVELILKQVQTL